MIFLNFQFEFLVSEVIKILFFININSTEISFMFFYYVHICTYRSCKRFYDFI